MRFAWHKDPVKISPSGTAQPSGLPLLCAVSHASCRLPSHSHGSPLFLPVCMCAVPCHGLGSRPLHSRRACFRAEGAGGGGGEADGGEGRREWSSRESKGGCGDASHVMLT